LPRYAIEELETRVLLSGFDAQQPAHLVTFELPPGSADVSSVVRPLLFIQRQMTSSFGAGGFTSASGSQWSSLANGSQPAPNDPPLVVLVHPSHSAVTEPTSSGAEGDPPTSFDGGQPFTMIAIPGNDSSSTGVGDFSSSINDAVLETTAGNVTPSPAVFLVPSDSDSGSGWVALQSTVPGQYASTSSSFDGPEVPVPLSPVIADMRGTLDAEQPAMTYDIPVGLMTQSLGVTVRPSAAMPAGEVPFVDEMSLVDSTGKTLEQVSPPGGAGGFPSSAVLVQLHDAPAGDRIQVEIAAAEASSSSSATSASSSSSGLGSGLVTTSAASLPANWNVQFVLNVQRQQSSPSSAESGTTIPGLETIGTLIVAPAQQPVLFASSSSSLAPTGQDGSTLLAVQATNSAVAAAPASDVVTESTDSFNLRVPTGPLASRGGGALGPTLAQVDAEPTQPVNRLERALSQEIVGLGAGDGELTAARRTGANDQELSDDPGTWPGSIGTAGTGGPVVSISGRGGFPLKVTALGRDQRGQFAALWATLPAAPNPASAVSNTALSAISLSELPIVPAVAYRSVPETLECPDFVKAACGLALGVGLTSGPLFPDLIASLPGRMPKWFSILRAHSKGRIVADESNRVAHRKMPGWLRALFVSR
jgi:hypothetical protein